MSHTVIEVKDLMNADYLEAEGWGQSAEEGDLHNNHHQLPLVVKNMAFHEGHRLRILKHL